jgi:hypothetical protein
MNDHRQQGTEPWLSSDHAIGSYQVQFSSIQANQELILKCKTTQKYDAKEVARLLVRSKYKLLQNNRKN